MFSRKKDVSSQWFMPRDVKSFQCEQEIEISERVYEKQITDLCVDELVHIFDFLEHDSNQLGILMRTSKTFCVVAGTALGRWKDFSFIIQEACEDCEDEVEIKKVLRSRDKLLKKIKDSKILKKYVESERKNILVKLLSNNGASQQGLKIEAGSTKEMAKKISEMLYYNTNQIEKKRKRERKVTRRLYCYGAGGGILAGIVSFLCCPCCCVKPCCILLCYYFKIDDKIRDSRFYDTSLELIFSWF